MSACLYSHVKMVKEYSIYEFITALSTSTVDCCSYYRGFQDHRAIKATEELQECVVLSPALSDTKTANHPVKREKQIPVQISAPYFGWSSQAT